MESFFILLPASQKRLLISSFSDLVQLMAISSLWAAQVSFLTQLLSSLPMYS